MIVSEFVEWLKTQDQGAIVEVVCHTSGGSYYSQGGNASPVEFDPTQEYEHWGYTDFRGNHFVKEDQPHYNKRYLMLGGMNC